MQFNIGVILVMLRDLNTVIDKVIFWQADRLLRPAKNTNISGSVTLATLHIRRANTKINHLIIENEGLSFLAGKG